MSKLIELIKKYETTNNYEEAFWDVVNWNAVAGKDKDPEAVAKQYMWVEEEFKEILEAKNEIDLVDGLIDVFVTSSQQYYNQFKEYPDYKIQIDSVAHGIDLMQDSINKKEHWRVYLLIESVLDRCSFDVMGALDEVLRSNDSKFPLLKDFNYDESKCVLECVLIEEQGRYTGVHYKLVDTKDGVRVVFLDDNKKIVKAPNHFKEPNLPPYIWV